MEKTTKQTNKGRFYLYRLLSFLAYVMPLMILFACQSSHYLQNVGTSLSFFGYIIVALILIALKDKLLDFAKKNTILTVSLVLFVVSAVMRYLADELLLISGVSVFGALLATVIEPVADVYKKRSDEEAKNGKTMETITHKNAWRLAYGFRER